MDIKTITVIPADKLIVINNESYRAEFAAAESIHAIQWFGDHGQIEQKTGPARSFMNLDMLDPYIAAWKKARASTLRTQHGETLKQIIGQEGLIASTDQAIEHLTEGLASLDAQIAEQTDETMKAVLQNHRVVMANDLDRAKRQATTVRQSHDSLSTKALVLDQQAAQAEHEAA